MDGKKMLVKYVRTNIEETTTGALKTSGPKVGVVVAVDSEKVGWAKCCRRDKFDKEFGLRIAIGRAKKGTNKEVPYALTGIYNEMIERSKLYFKQQ
jgi:hypothetical protein